MLLFDHLRWFLFLSRPSCLVWAVCHSFMVCCHSCTADMSVPYACSAYLPVTWHLLAQLEGLEAVLGLLIVFGILP
jgi:hypothetical protein